VGEAPAGRGDRARGLGVGAPLYRSLVPRLVLPLHARLSGRRFWAEYRHLQALQWSTPAALEARSLGKLRSLVTHAMAHVPFYRDRFREAGVRPDALRTPDDLASLPITRKADLRDSGAERAVADNLPAARRWRTVTSGSTGFPFAFFTDATDADGVVAAYLLCLDWAGAAIWQTRIDIGVRGGRPMPSVLPEPPRPARWVRHALLGDRAVALSGADLSPEEFLARARECPRRGYFVRGYAAYLGQLAQRLREAGIHLPTPPRVVISGGESLTGLDRTAIERAFGCRLVNHYAAWEAPHMAQTCPDNPELLHVNSERVLLRVVGDDGAAARPGSRGRIVVTALRNWVMPFINYEIEDAGVAGPPCPCGRGFPTLATLEGRLGEVIRTPAGRLVTPVTLDAVLRFHADTVREYQAERTAADAVTLRIVPTRRFRPEDAALLQGELARHVGPGMDVRVDVVDTIPLERSGKRFVIKPGGGSPLAPGVRPPRVLTDPARPEPTGAG
jgi:phenylacetate-CoA ligase